jgi:hypothetical protein
MLSLPWARWRRVLLRLRLVMFRALIATIEAVVTTPQQGGRVRRDQITPNQMECTHRYRARRGNASGTGEYCTACGLRLEWTPARRATPLAVTRATRRSLATVSEATPVRRAPPSQPQRAPQATRTSASAPAASSSFAEDIPEEPQLRTPPLDVNQYPTWEESEAGNVDLVMGRVLCACGLPMIRARVAQNPAQVSTYCWKCPRLVGEQCRTALYEVNLEAYVMEDPDHRHALYDPLSQPIDAMSQGGDDF